MPLPFQDIRPLKDSKNPEQQGTDKKKVEERFSKKLFRREIVREINNSKGTQQRSCLANGIFGI